ncbi:MAG TPA: DUF5654 family protein [Patescibacteria group bacterium]|nr:DUF5654 family protein [Patescibacteria group bacterium]
MSQKSLKLELLEKISQLATAGLGLVAALAWNDAIQSLFKIIFPQQSEVWAKFGYAVLITVIVVFITLKLGDLINKVKQQLVEEKKEDGEKD